MGAKRALIVDDSKSARLSLSRMLEKFSIDVDSAETAEQAIDYLGHHRPDVIFMDHLMPGMDGFQAVQAIKNNPRTATIPIMMYTSQEGELYLGQARALGAVGVLPKQIKPADVSKVLYQLHLVPDRRSGEQTSFRALTLATSEDSTDGGAPPATVKPLTESGLREQFAELRRALVAGIDTQSERITADVRALLMQLVVPTEAALPPLRRQPLPWIVACAALLLAIVSTGLWWNERTQQRAVPAAPTAAATQPRSAASSLAAAPQTRAGVASGDAASAPGEAPLPTDERPLVAGVPYGDEPLGGPRLELIRQLLGRLASQGVHGVLDVRLYPGRFCLVGNATDGFSPAPDETPAAKCDAVGNPREDAREPSQRVPLAFANLVGEFHHATAGALDVQVNPGDAGETAVPYPTTTGDVTAGEWNRAASANNRIEVRLH